MQPGCSAMVARYNWRVSSSSARWRQGGIRRVHRKGPATAYARNCGASSGAQSASRPSCARCGIWRTRVCPSRRASHPVRPHAHRAGSSGSSCSECIGLELTWTAVAGARTIDDGPAIEHRPSRPEKLTLRADVEVALAVERKVGARQDALFSLAHVPNRDVRRDAGADHPIEELTGAVRRVRGEPFGLEPQSLLSPFNHRLRGSHLVISAGWRSLYVDDNRVLDVDQIIEPIAKLDALVSLRGPGRARIHRRDHLCRLA